MSDKEHNCCGGNNDSCCGGSNNQEGHSCGCNHNNEEEQYLTVLLENDEELKCSVIDIFEVNEKEYIALLPVGSEQVLLYQYLEHSEDDFELLNIEGEEEFAQVEEAFFEIFDEELFDDEEEYEYDDYDDEDDEE